jgi:hypothetical protein
LSDRFFFTLGPVKFSNSSVYSRRGDGGFTPIFDNSPLFFQKTGENFTEETRKKSTNVINSHFSLKIPPVKICFSNLRIDTAAEDFISQK